MLGLVDALISKTMAWEEERGTEFYYDGVRLLSMLEECTILRREKEEERRRRREQKKFQGQLKAEPEAIYGTKSSPTKAQAPIVKNTPKTPKGGAGNRRLPFGGAMLRTPRLDPCKTAKAMPYSRPARENDKVQQIYNQEEEFDTFSVCTSDSGDASSVYEVESPLFREPLSPISESRGVLDDNIMHLEEASTHGCVVEEDPKAIEYSFEERRAGFAIMEKHVDSTIPCD